MNLVINDIYTENDSAFCNKNNVEECVQYLTKEFLSLGVTGLSEVESHNQMKNFLSVNEFINNNNNNAFKVENLSNNDLKNVENLVWVINNAYKMVKKLRRAHESKSILQDSYTKVSSELSQTRRECDRWKEKVEKMEKDLGCVENQKDLMQKKLIEMEKCLKKEKSEARSSRLELTREEEKSKVRVGKLQRQLDTLSMKLRNNSIKDLQFERKHKERFSFSTAIQNANDLKINLCCHNKTSKNVEDGSETFSENFQTNDLSEKIEKNQVSHSRKPNQKSLHSKTTLSSFQTKKNLSSTKIHRKLKGNIFKKSNDLKVERKINKKSSICEEIIANQTNERDDTGSKINDATFTEDVPHNARIRRRSYTILKHSVDEDCIKKEVDADDTECGNQVNEKDIVNILENDFKAHSIVAEI